MRRNYISNEYTNSIIPGTFNMIEESNYFGSKMLEIEDSIYHADQNLIYYQQPNGEQFDISIESSLTSVVYSASSDKNENHTIKLDLSQSISQKNNNTKWIIEINISNILSNYLFVILKRYRTFEGIKTNMTLNNDVNTAIKKYVYKNVVNRYKYKSLDFYVNYTDLKNQNVLQFINNWEPNISIESNKSKKLQTELSYDNSNLKLIYNQEKPSKDYSFQYYFNILFEKI